MRIYGARVVELNLYKKGGREADEEGTKRDRGRERVFLLFFLCLKKAAIFQVVLDDHIRDGIKDELDVGRVRGACEMCVNLLLVPPLVQALKLHLDVGRRFLVRVGSRVLREADGERGFGNLLLKEVLLVQKQDYGRLHEPLVVAD